VNPQISQIPQIFPQMKLTTKSLLLVACALLCCEAVAAEPVSIFIGTLLGLTGTAAAVVGSIILGTVTTIGLGFLQRALAPKPPKLRNELADRLVTVRQAISYRRWVCGTVGKLAGIITFFHQAEVSGAHYDYYVVTLSGRRLKSIGNLYFDDEQVPLDGSGNATGKYAGLVSVEKNLGGDDQAALSLLTTDIASKWTANHRQRGCAHAGLRLKFDPDKLPQTPNIRFDVEGPEVYDPRTGTFVFTANAALQYADYLTDIRHGAKYSRKLRLGDVTVSGSGLGNFTAGNVGNGDVSDTAFDVDAASAGAYLQVDFGAGAAKEVNWVRVYAKAGGGAAQWKVRSSDDDVSYTDRQEFTLLSDVAGWKYVRVAGNGAHRYWRLELANTPGAGPDFAEVEWFESEVDRAQLIVAADVCDEDVTLAAGGTEDRYTINGTWTMDLAPADVLPGLREAMAGWDAEVESGWKIYAGAYVAPTVTLTKDDLRATATPLVVRARKPKPELFNTLHGTFSGAVTDWQPAGLPAVTSAAYVAEDDGETLAREAQLPFTTSAPRGQRVLKIALERTRRQKAVTWRGKLSCWRVEAGQTVALTVPECGWTAKPFLVTKFALVEDREGEEGVPALAVDLELAEWESAIFDWDETVDEQPFNAPPTLTFPDPSSTGNPTGNVGAGAFAGVGYRPLTNPLTAIDDGSTATVNVAGFTMRILGRGDVSITAGNVTGLTLGQLYYIYYDDQRLAGGAVSFQATTTKEAANTGRRFFVGSITTPVDGGGSTLGNNDGGLGGQNGFRFRLPFSYVELDAGGGNWTDKKYASDADDINYATSSLSGDGSFQTSALDLTRAAALLGAFKSLSLKVISEVPANSLDGTGDASGRASVSYVLGMSDDGSNEAGQSFLTVFSVAAGVTRSKQTDTVSLSPLQNTGRLGVTAQVRTSSADSTGTVELRIYEAWLEVEI
jgi:hypothetical protein